MNGRLRLRVTNQQSEIDFLDRVGLTALEVPDGATAVTTPEGSLDVLRSPEPPVEARSEREPSVVERLRTADGQEHVMPPWSSSVDLEFDPGEDLGPGPRVFVVEATGHYRILVPARGTPQHALFARLLAEPGAFGRHAIGTLRREALRQGTVLAAP